MIGLLVLTNPGSWNCPIETCIVKAQDVSCYMKGRYHIQSPLTRSYNVSPGKQVQVHMLSLLGAILSAMQNYGVLWMDALYLLLPTEDEN